MSRRSPEQTMARKVQNLTGRSYQDSLQLVRKWTWQQREWDSALANLVAPQSGQSAPTGKAKPTIKELLRKRGFDVGESRGTRSAILQDGEVIGHLTASQAIRWMKDECPLIDEWLGGDQ